MDASTLSEFRNAGALNILDRMWSLITKVKNKIEGAATHDSLHRLYSSGLPFTNHHNARSAHLTFHIPRAGICHGFAGYFEATLYGDVTLSIHPERAAGDMLSWFPIFFPLMVSGVSLDGGENWTD